MSNLSDAVKLLDDAGVLERIREDAQAEREAERDELLAKLRKVEAADAENGKRLAAEIDRAAGQVARIEEDLRAAKMGLHELTSERSALGMSAQKVKGKLVRLADPRLDAAIVTIRDLMDKARQRFTIGHEIKRNPYTGSKQLAPVSNGETIAELQAGCRMAIAKLETLKESSRPDNLQGVIDEVVTPIRDDVRRLFGV